MLTLNSALEQLQMGDFHARWDVAKSLPSFGEAAVNPLVQLLQDPGSDPELQWVIAKVLGEFSQSKAMAALGELLHNTEDEDLLHIAAYTLAQKGVHAIPALSAAVDDDETALAAIQALAQIRNPEVIAPLLRGMDSDHAEVRAAALEALCLWHDARIPPLLCLGLRDPHPQVRQVAVTGIGYRPSIVAQSDLLGPLSSMVWDVNPGVCKQAILTLGRLATEPATDVLVAALPKVVEPTCRTILIQTLGRLGTMAAVQGLQATLAQDGTAEDRLVMVEALARAETEPAQALASQALTELLTRDHDGQDAVRLKCAIANSLGHLKQTQALATLIELLAEPDLGVQLHAIAALKQLDAEQAHAQLLDLTTDQTLNPDLAAGVQLALQEW